MSESVIAACVQVCAGPEITPNLERTEALIREAAGRGAQLIVLPENVSLMIQGRDNLFARVSCAAEHPAIAFFRRMARETQAWIVGGSIGVHVGDDRLANRSYLFDPSGAIVTFYDKLHMFDADLSDEESYRESLNYRPGDQMVVAATPWGPLGLTICYDLRFPQLYRALGKAGASIITVSAAFAATTGQAHWHVLLRARAIETGAFILASAQCGEHDGGRRTYGHSMIVTPWGAILAEAGEEPCVITATLDLGQVAETRRKLPSLQHDRDFTTPRR